MSKNKIRLALHSQVRRYLEEILFGTMHCYDPSVGSRSSMPGYAIYEEGELVESGTIEVAPSWSLAARMQAIGEAVRDFGVPDVAAVEGLPARAYGRGRSRSAHASLLQGRGAIVSNIQTEAVISVDARVWHGYTDPDYVKGDAEDAEMVGWCLLCLAEAKYTSCEE